MRRFHFRLETVLRQREIIEDLRERDFAFALGQAKAFEAQIAQGREEMRRIVEGRPETKSGEPLDAPIIQNRERYIAVIQERIVVLEMHLAAARIIAEEMRKALVVARQARETVSKLKEKDYAVYLAEGLKQEQEALDEMATLRYLREQQGRAAQTRIKEER